MCALSISSFGGFVKYSLSGLHITLSELNRVPTGFQSMAESYAISYMRLLHDDILKVYCTQGVNIDLLGCLQNRWFFIDLIN